MPTAAEVKAQLTGPGGPFEVVTEEVNGRPMQVYKDRMKALRQICEVSIGRGDQVFIVYGDHEIGFHDFLTTANSVSSGLQRQGIGRGDRVAVLSQNNPEWCLSFWGTVNIGGILVGLNGWWTTDEIVYGLQDSGARVLVADAKRLERVVEHLDDLPVEVVYLVGADPSELGGHPKIRRFAELVADPTDDMPAYEPVEADPAVIFYTSGTTGKPKGAISTHRNMIANLQNTVFVLTAGQMEAAAAAA